jgi:hypothetical protein
MTTTTRLSLTGEYETLSLEIAALASRLGLARTAESRQAIARKAMLACERRMLVAAALGMTAEGMRV